MATIIVSNSGAAGAPGSVAQPVKTIAQALALAKPGDTIMLREGEYAGGVTVEQPNITIKNYPGEHAVISTGTASGSPDWAVRFGVDAHGGALDGLEIKGGEYYCVKLESTWDWGGNYPQDGVHNITIQNCVLHDSGRDVIKVTPGCDGLQILNNEIYNSGRRDGSNAEGIDVVNADNVVIRGNYIHDTATTGVYIKGGVDNGLIENNYIKNTGTGGAGGFSFGNPPNSGAGIMLGYGTDLEYFDKDNPQLYQTMNSIVRNNIVENTGDGGILVWGSLNPQVYNNTLQNVSTHPWYFGGGIMIAGIDTWTPSGDVFTKSVNPMVMNNIVTVAAPVSGSPGYVTHAALAVINGGVTGPLQIDYNLLNGLGNHGGKLFDRGNGEITLAQWQAQLGADGHSKVGVPGLDGNLHLAPGSIAIDAGVAIPGLTQDFDGRPLSGGAVDMGADQGDAGPVVALPQSGGIGKAPGKGATVPGEGGDGRPSGGNPPPPPPPPTEDPDGPGNPPPPPTSDPVFLPLVKAVAGVSGVYAGPDANNVALDGHLKIKLTAAGSSDWTAGRLRIVEEPSGKIAGEIDFVKGDAYDGKQILDIDLSAFHLKAGVSYSIVTTNDFIRVNAAPWKAGAIARGEWKITTAGESVPDAPPPPPPPPPPPQEPTDPDAPSDGVPPGAVFAKLAKAVAGVAGVWTGPDSAHVKLDGHLGLKLVTAGIGEWSSGRLKIVEEPSGKTVGEIDFVKGDAYDGKQVLDIDLAQFALKAGTTYSVVTTNDFVRVNAAPWKAGAITRGQWQFTTDTEAPAAPFAAAPAHPLADADGALFVDDAVHGLGLHAALPTIEDMARLHAAHAFDLV